MYNVAAEYYITLRNNGGLVPSETHPAPVLYSLNWSSLPAHQNLQINWCSYIHLNEPALNAESLLEEVEREKDKSSRCSWDSIQFRPTAAGFHKNAIFNLVSLCILKYARPYHCHLCYVTPRPTELMDPVMICNKNPSSSHSQLVLQTINRRSCTYNHGEGPY